MQASDYSVSICWMTMWGYRYCTLSKAPVCAHVRGNENGMALCL